MAVEAVQIQTDSESPTELMKATLDGPWEFLLPLEAIITFHCTRRRF